MKEVNLRERHFTVASLLEGFSRNDGDQEKGE